MPSAMNLTPGQKAERLEALATIEDALYTARGEFQGPNLRQASAICRQLANRMLEAKASIDQAITLIEEERRAIERPSAGPAPLREDLPAEASRRVAEAQR